MPSFTFPFLLLFSCISITMGQEPSYDLIIRQARVIDGTGSPWYLADVGVSNGLVSYIGSIPPFTPANYTVNANSSYLSPGFIDSHTHDDIALLEKPAHEFKLVQGVTTVVTGNCGFSNYPNGDNAMIQSHLRSLLGEVPSSYFFRDFSSARDALSVSGTGPNVASLVGHGPLRISVLGYENRPASPAEIQEMASLLDAQLAQGAAGLSLGLVYAPSSYSEIEELASLAAVVKKYDRILSAHVRSYEGGLLTSIEEFLEILRRSGARGLLSHLQVAGVPYWNTSIPLALDLLESARQEGIDVTCDMYPYLAGSSTILQLLPPSSLSGGFDQLLENLQDAEFLSYLKNMTESGSEPGWESKVALIGYSNIVIGSVVNQSLSQYEGLPVPEASTLMGLQPGEEFQFIVELIKADSGMTNVIMFQQSQADNHQVFASRLQLIGSDSIPRSGGGGKPHPRGYGTFPRVLGQYAKNDGIFSLEEAVRKASSQTARTFGIRDRGLILPGMRADLVLFSDQIADQASYEDPTRGPKGIEGVWVNGVMVVDAEGGLINEGILPGVVLALT